MKFRNFSQFNIKFKNRPEVKNFLDNWKKIYDISKTKDRNYRINRIVNNPIDEDNISNIDIIYNDDNTIDMDIIYKNGNKTKLINLEILDTYHIHDQNCNHENLDPTKLTFTINYENIL